MAIRQATRFYGGARESLLQLTRLERLYVYLNYGVHWLLNFLVKGKSANGFVLIRALEPTERLPTDGRTPGWKRGAQAMFGSG